MAAETRRNGAGEEGRKYTYGGFSLFYLLVLMYSRTGS